MMPTDSTTETHYSYLVRTVTEHGASDACLIWPFAVCKWWGYAYVKIPGERYGKRVHRVAYKIKYGHYPVHDGCHTCDNRACYNPNHIFDGTDKDNFADMVAKGRSARGERNHFAVATEEIVIQIREEYATGAWTRIQLGERHGLSLGAIKKIVRRATWRHI
jgi:hypothetical protein